MNNKLFLIIGIVAVMFVSGCIKQNEVGDVGKILQDFKANNRDRIVGCANQYPQDAKSICSCLGGLGIVIQPDEGPILVCGNSQRNMPYLDIKYYLE